MKITREQIDAYIQTLGDIEDEASSLMERAVRNLRYGTPEDRQRSREQLMDVFETLEDVYGAASGDTAIDLMNGVFSSNGLETIPKMGDSATQRSMRGTVAYWFDKSRDGESVDVDALADNMSKAIKSYIRRSANGTIAENVESFGTGSKGLRYMRVPVGPHTCAFCLMLCSRGPVYASQISAGDMAHFHEGCDCIVVPGFGEFTVEGYDWRGYRSWWNANIVTDSYGHEDFDATFNSFRRSVYRNGLRDHRNELRRIDYARKKLSSMTSAEHENVVSAIRDAASVLDGKKAASVSVGGKRYWFRADGSGGYTFVLKEDL